MRSSKFSTFRGILALVVRILIGLGVSRVLAWVALALMALALAL